MFCKEKDLEPSFCFICGGRRKLRCCAHKDVLRLDICGPGALSPLTIIVVAVGEEDKEGGRKSRQECTPAWLLWSESQQMLFICWFEELRLPEENLKYVGERRRTVPIIIIIIIIIIILVVLSDVPPSHPHLSLL